MSELPRRLWHIFGGLSLPVSGLLVPENIFLPALISLTMAFLLFELIRLKFSWLNRRFFTSFRALLREKEASTLTASAYLLIAASIIFILADKSIAAIALTFVVVGDPIAGMVRDLRGGPPFHPTYLTRGVRGISGKGLKGSCACFLACVVAGAILAAITHVALWPMVVGAVCATAIEFLSLRVNDNLTIPLAAGGIMMLIQLLCF